MQKWEKTRPERQEKRKVSSRWNKICLIHSKNFNAEANTPNKSTQQNPIQENNCMKLDSVARDLNPFNEVPCSDKKTESPIRHSIRCNYNSIFCMIRCHEMWYGTTESLFLASILLLTLLLLCYMTVSRMALTWHFCGGCVLQKVDINLLVLHEAL